MVGVVWVWLAAAQAGAPWQRQARQALRARRPHCVGQVRIIAFITFSADIHKILDHIEVDPEAPRIVPARGPPLWEGEGAQETGEGVEGVEALPDWDLANQSPPDYPDDQRTDW